MRAAIEARKVKHTESDLRKAWKAFSQLEGVGAPITQADAICVAQAIADERERCAKVAEGYAAQHGVIRSLSATHSARAATDVAAAIRSQP
jgi:hypothetical protein